MKRFVITITLLVMLQQFSYSISDTSKDYLKEYSENVPVNQAIGQLFIVGLPDVDYKTYNTSENSIVQELITELGVGGVMMNTYNFYISDNDFEKTGSNEYLNNIQNMINHLQRKSLDSKSSLPLFIAVDFESQYSSIRNDRGVELAPSALTMGHVDDLDLITELGLMVGNQLSKIGINMILGPVLDTPESISGIYNTTLANRYFSSNIDVTFAIASHYISGLVQGNLLVIAKHFPGYCDINENPHQGEPSFIGNKNIIENNKKIYENLSEYFNGIMTANYYYDKVSEDIPWFLSLDFKKEVRNSEDKLGLNDKIVMTDDLSNMKILESYKDKNDYDYSKIAIKAFNSGHDILLYSHLGNKGSLGKFKKEDFINVVNDLEEYIAENEMAEEQFRQSLYRILLLKQKYHLAKGYTEDHSLFAQAWQTEKYGNISDEISINQYNKDYTNNSNLIKDILLDGTVLINSNNNIKIENKDVVVVGKKPNKIIEGIINNVRSVHEIEVPLSFSSLDQLYKYCDDIDLSNEESVIIFIVESKDHSTIIERLHNTGKVSQKNTIVLNHFNPIIFDEKILNKFTVLNTMSMLDLSYEIDKEFLLGKVFEKSKFRINIGENNSFSDVTNRDYNLKPGIPINTKSLLLSEREIKLIKQNKQVTKEYGYSELKNYHNSIIKNKLEEELLDIKKYQYFVMFTFILYAIVLRFLFNSILMKLKEVVELLLEYLRKGFTKIKNLNKLISSIRELIENGKFVVETIVALILLIIYLHNFLN
jgi:beta-glucosidase-like glycosyl hydrolase